ncbi:unnamed protein product [Cylicocyclus nassatus]|uniref:POU domain protein n=1 Tax=Cylicocyclus nassatus TaxID=53992 RepID=A0AA36LZH9_CYLNA|nr:unnamed protein product [Cylicocyclus nassatus]
MEIFRKNFRTRRIQLGFSQTDVSEALPANLRYSQTTISRFENGLLCLKKMCELRYALESWLKKVDSSYVSSSNSNEPSSNKKKMRKRRTFFEDAVKTYLEGHFAANPLPDQEILMKLAHELNLSYQVVRIWFCNRRQKKRREDAEAKVPLPEAIILDRNSCQLTVRNASNSVETVASSHDPYPLEELSEISDIYPFQ